jgi:hypothetical protein
LISSLRACQPFLPVGVTLKKLKSQPRQWTSQPDEISALRGACRQAWQAILNI